MPIIVWADPLNFIAVDTSFSLHENKAEFRINIPYPLVYPSSDQTEQLKFATDYFNSRFILENEESRCVLTLQEVTEVSMHGAFLCDKNITAFKNLKLQSTLFTDLFREVNHFVKIVLGDEEIDVLFTKEKAVFVGAKQDSKDMNLFTTMKQFGALGIPHILFGFDHILFILAVHSIVRRYKDILMVVTSFTIAHSLTFILAALGFITVTARIVEPLIALSIGYTAVRNIIILEQGKGVAEVLKERLMTTFGFGLVHGLGFAGALSEIQVPKHYFIPALLSFNVGVEIGQFIIIALFILFLAGAKRIGWLHETIYGLSASIAIISLVLIIERIF